MPTPCVTRDDEESEHETAARAEPRTGEGNASPHD